MTNYGEQIAVLRKLHNMTQADLGRVLNVSYQAVSKWERNESEPDFGTLSKMCEHFKISLDDFAKGNREVKEEIAIVPIAAAASEVVLAPKVVKPDLLGTCTQCGVIITSDTLGESSPKMVCKPCVQKNEADKEMEAAREANNREMLRTSTKRRMRRKIILSLILPLILVIVILSSDSIKTNGLFGTLVGGLVIVAWVFAFIYQCQTPSSPVRGVLDSCYGFSVRMPGLIFTFDLDGIFWLIGMKLLFALVGVIVATVAMILGIICSFLICLVTFPITLVREIAIIRGKRAY